MRMGSWTDYLNVTLAPASFLCMVIYSVNLYFRLKRNPMGTVMGINHCARRAWVRDIMEDNSKKNILAVQTLRNSIMGSTLLATTDILLSSAVAAFLASSYDIKKSLHNALVGTQDDGDLIVTYLSLLTGLLFSFGCLVQSVRYTNHVNFLINIPIQGQFTPDYVADVLERGANLYSIGVRATNMSIPILLWIFGPMPFFVSTVIMLSLLYWLDTAQSFASSSARAEICVPHQHDGQRLSPINSLPASSTSFPRPVDHIC